MSEQYTGDKFTPTPPSSPSSPLRSPNTLETSTSTKNSSRQRRRRVSTQKKSTEAIPLTSSKRNTKTTKTAKTKKTTANATDVANTVEKDKKQKDVDNDDDDDDDVDDDDGKEEDSALQKLEKMNRYATMLHVVLLFVLIGFVGLSSVDTNVILLSTRNHTVYDEALDKLSLQDSKIALQERTSVNLAVLFLCVTVVTIIAHVFYQYSDIYKRHIKRGWNPFRWLEYGLSASIMLMIIAILCGIRTLNTLVMIVLATAVIMFMGYLNEHDIVDRRVGLRSFLSFGVAWILLLGIWWMIYDKFIDGMNNSSAQAPGSIQYLLILMFFFFASFGILHTVRLVREYRRRRNNKSDQYHKYEYGYIVLSYVSKAVLLLWCLFGVFVGGIEWLHTRPRQF